MDTKVDEVMASRELYEEADKRVIDLDDAMVGLESDEVTCRKSIDKLLSDTSEDGVIKYQMKTEQLAAIRSKMTHVRQSKGVAYQSLLDTQSDYHLVLSKRTRHRKLEMREKLESWSATELENLQEAAETFMTSFSILNGVPTRAIDLNKILKKQPDYLLNIEAKIKTINEELEVDDYE